MGDGGGQAVLLIIYKTNIGNLEGVYLALSQVNKGSICESYLSPMEKDDLSRTQNGGEQSFNHHGFSGAHSSAIIQHCQIPCPSQQSVQTAPPLSSVPKMYSLLRSWARDGVDLGASGTTEGRSEMSWWKQGNSVRSVTVWWEPTPPHSSLLYVIWETKMVSNWPRSRSLQILPFIEPLIKVLGSWPTDLWRPVFFKPHSCTKYMQSAYLYLTF